MEVRDIPQLDPAWHRYAAAPGEPAALLPQHARHCPVLEAGSGLASRCIPRSSRTSRITSSSEGEGQYRFTYLQDVGKGQWQPIYTLIMTLPFGGIGMIKEQVDFQVPNPPFGIDAAKQLTRAFIVPEDLGTPQGAISCCAATRTSRRRTAGTRCIRPSSTISSVPSRLC